MGPALRHLPGGGGVQAHLPPAQREAANTALEAGQGEGRTIQKIQRMDEDPSMFYKADMQAMCDTLFTPC